MTLEQVLANQRQTAQILRSVGHVRDAQILEELCSQVSSAAESYLRWLSENDAMLRSGRSRRWLRSLFPIWERAGDARRDGRKHYYRMIVVPNRMHATDAYEAGRRTGEGQAA